MKNIRLLVSGLCLFLATGLGSNHAMAQSRVAAPSGATMKLQIERKEITPEEAARIIQNNEIVSLGLYAIFSPEWGDEIKNVFFDNSSVSWAFYETEAFSQVSTSTDPAHYLQNPADYIKICAVPGNPGQPADACIIDPGSWYGNQQPHTFGWPSYAWGTGFNGSRIDMSSSYATQLPDGSYRIKIIDVQFQLKSLGARNSFPVGFVDDIVAGKLDGSNANCQLNPAKYLVNTFYWPQNGGVNQTCNACPTCQYCQDWTDLKGTKFFEFIPGGLFIKMGPEVETFEPFPAPKSR